MVRRTAGTRAATNVQLVLLVALATALPAVATRIGAWSLDSDVQSPLYSVGTELEYDVTYVVRTRERHGEPRPSGQMRGDRANHGASELAPASLSGFRCRVHLQATEFEAGSGQELGVWTLEMRLSRVQAAEAVGGDGPVLYAPAHADRVASLTRNPFVLRQTEDGKIEGVVFPPDEDIEVS